MRLLLISLAITAGLLAPLFVWAMWRDADEPLPLPEDDRRNK